MSIQQLQKLTVKSSTSQAPQTPLTFNLSDVDSLFPGFRAGDLAVLYGGETVTSLTALLCVRAQLPTFLGGLESDVVFIDCANSSSLSDIEHVAQLQRLNAQETLERVQNMRVYTAYRLTSLIMEKLQQAVETTDAKLVLISDIAGPFLRDNVDDQEARTVYSQIMNYLAGFAKKHQIIIVATYLTHENNKRNSVLQEITNAKANTVLRFTKTPYTSDVELEKHPSYMLGVVEFNPEIPASGPIASNRNAVPTLSYRILPKSN